jgi:putative hydrolase of the HAD superfamily
VFISAEVGFAKPSREMFDHAALALGLPPAQLLHVGDSASADAAGALSAGWNAALLGGEHPGAIPIGSLAELPALLR